MKIINVHAHVWDDEDVEARVAHYSCEGMVRICLIGREDSYGKYDLYVSFPEGDDSWTEPVNLGEGVNGPESEFRPYVTGDGEYLFFTTSDPVTERGRIFWVSSDVVHAKRTGE